MPTGYTAGILDGKIKSFPEFAKLCMRAFGATIHMRDESMDKEYEPRVPNKYHSEELKKAEDKKQEWGSMTDDEAIDKKRKELEVNKSRYEEYIETAKKHHEKLSEILEGVNNWQPPTTDHTGIKDFMVQQLTDTISHDGSGKYYHERLSEINKQLENLNAADIRAEMAANIDHDIKYHTDELNKEIDRCNSANKWVEDYLKSITP